MIRRFILWLIGKPYDSDACPTCRGEGWMMHDEGQMCPDCQREGWLGGTGRRGGAQPLNVHKVTNP